jgi:hypothetical protein
VLPLGTEVRIKEKRVSGFGNRRMQELLLAAKGLRCLIKNGILRAAIHEALLFKAVRGLPDC